MKKIYQYRFYGNSDKNYPSDLSSTLLISGDVFSQTGKGSITHLGI
jgi:hypothetical protein